MSDHVAARIRALLDERGAGRTLCPSEVARDLAGPAGEWRAAMPSVHAAVDALIDAGEIALSWQGGALVRREGPYRIGRSA